MKLDHSSATIAVADMMSRLDGIATKHSGDEIGSLVNSALKGMIPSISRLEMAERRSSNAAIASISSSAMMTVAAVFRRHNLIDDADKIDLRNVVALASALLNGRKVSPRKSMPIDIDPPANWKPSRIRIGGFERNAHSGRRLHITRDIHAHGKQWILYYDGVSIDIRSTIEEVVASAAEFNDFVGVAS